MTAQRYKTTRRRNLSSPTPFKKIKTRRLPQNASRRPRCQCLHSCKRVPIPGQPFCSFHQTSCPRQSPLSGYEPPYEPDRWNLARAIRETHNCFAYAFNFIDPKQQEDCNKSADCNTPFHQPGSASGYNRFTKKDPKTCPNMIARLMGDNPTLRPTTFTAKCPTGTSKIALIIDEDQDYHFLRQDSNSLFSEKHGGLPVTNRDALGYLIYDPELANHNWSKNNDPLNYDISCGFFCVPRDRPLYLRIGGRRVGI